MSERAKIWLGSFFLKVPIFMPWDASGSPTWLQRDTKSGPHCAYGDQQVLNLNLSHLSHLIPTTSSYGNPGTYSHELTLYWALVYPSYTLSAGRHLSVLWPNRGAWSPIQPWALYRKANLVPHICNCCIRNPELWGRGSAKFSLFVDG